MYESFENAMDLDKDLKKKVNSILLSINQSIKYYPTPPPQAGGDTRSIFKWSTAGFPSSRLVALPRLKNPICPTIYWLLYHG